MQEAPARGRSENIPIGPPIAPHLRESAVLKMLHEEEGVNHIGSGHVPFGSWPPPGHGQMNRPMGFMTKVTRGAGGRPVEWPPRPELSRSQENLDQVSRRRLPPTRSSRSQTPPPPVPPRPANYPQANMDQVQVQHQQQHQQMVMQQQQQQRQQVASMQMKTVRQVQQYQTYEQQYGTESQGSVQYQMVPQPTLQYHQMTQQQSTSSTSSYPSAQHVPAGVEHQVPIQMASAPQQHHGPKHGVPTPFANQNSMMSPPSSANHNTFMTEPSNEHVVPIQHYTNQNAGPAPPQQMYQNAAAPPPQYAHQNAGPYQYADAQNAQHAQNAQYAQHAQNAQHGQDTPQYASGTTQDNPDGYTTAYSTIRGEWPPKQHNDAPNLTTTYPSGFKLKDQAPYQTGPGKVVTSQPAFKITQPIRRSGDDKWPPRGSNEPTQEEVREFIKPKKSNRNYEEFFAQNALPHNYAGYRPPPGTQHHGLDEMGESGISEM